MLRLYQSEAVGFLAERGRALLALPPGAGKTAIVSDWLPAGRCLIVAPNGPVLDHWKHEMHQWGEREACLVGVGTKIQRHRARTFSSGDLIINYECMRNDIEELLQYEWAAVVFDESHRLKGRKITFKAAARLAKVAPKLVLVTGTPVLNRAEELWTSLHLIDPVKYRSFWRWVEQRFHIVFPRYRRRIVREICHDRRCKTCGGKGILSPEHEQLMRKEIGSVMFYRPLREILPDLPEVIETTYEVELSTEERKAHESMQHDFWMEVGGDIVHAVNTVAKMTQLRKLASDWSVFGEPAGTKAKTAAQLVVDLDGEQCIVFCAFRATAEAVADLLGDKAVPYHGGHSENTRALAINLFKEGEIQVLVATIATLGEGVDGLQVAHNAIFIDRDWTPARNTQAIGRLQRQGQRNAVNVIHVVAADTIDNVVADALATKKNVVEAIIEGRSA